MAEITFSLEELLRILISNRLLPPEILRPRTGGDRIHFVIRTNSFILPFIPASLRFLSFDDNNAIFELTLVSSRLNRGTSRFDQIFELRIPPYIKVDYPKISVDVDQLLKEKNIRGVGVKDISFEHGEFRIITCNI